MEIQDNIYYICHLERHSSTRKLAGTTRDSCIYIGTEVVERFVTKPINYSAALTGAVVSSVNAVLGATKSSITEDRAKYNQNKLNEVDKNSGQIKEYGKIKGMRPDFIDINERTVNNWISMLKN